MASSVWVYFFDQIPAQTRSSISALLRRTGIAVQQMSHATPGTGLVFLHHVDPLALERIRTISGAGNGELLAIVVGARPGSAESWSLLSAGAADVLAWEEVPGDADPVIARLQHWASIAELIASTRVGERLVGQSPEWRKVLRQVVEVAAFSTASMLVIGESGTGKELIAGLVHDLDPRPQKRELVTVDCTTLAPELAGSELFGHERGAFTGAAGARDGAFALADHGTLFLDEVGELSLPLQAQLLRVVQERQYKRLGGNTWQHTHFRLVCATNRDLARAVVHGSFRSDLYHRIAGWVCQTPALRDRREDILLLTRHFLKQLAATDVPPDLDSAVRDFLVGRDYPGNVRDLRQVVTRIWHRHAGPGPITVGDVPPIDRPVAPLAATGWQDCGFESAIRHAVQLGIGLREIGRAAADTAMAIAVEQEDGNLQRAARRLGVTDRALQMRRASRRLTDGN